MAKLGITELPQTKGTFEIQGKVTGTKKEDYFKESYTKKGKLKRSIKFGVEYSEDENGFTNTLFISFDDYTKEDVYLYKKAEKKGDKGELKKVNWSERYDHTSDGFEVIGMKVGVKKTVNEKGETVNLNKNLITFDAIQEIADNLTDGQSVYIRGNVEYNSFVDKDGNRVRMKKLIPTQISLCKDIDFTDEKYNPKHYFGQQLILNGIEKEIENEKETGRFVVSAQVATYNTIENVEFIVTNPKFARTLKRLKPYTALEVYGKISSNTLHQQVVEVDDEWGDENPMDKVKSSFKTEYIITGGKKETVDCETFSKDKIENAIAKIAQKEKAKNDYADTTDSEWGSDSIVGNDDDNDDMEEWA